MAEYYRSHFQIADEEIAGLALLDKVQSVVQSWIESRFLEYPGKSDEPRFDSKRGDESGVFSLVWRLSDGWQLDIRLVTSGDGVEAEVEVRATTEIESDNQSSFAYSPGILKELFDTFDCRLNNTRITPNIQRLTEREAITLLLNRHRQLPVVVVTQDRNDQYLITPDFLQKRLRGIAMVITYSDSVAQVVNRELPNHRCFGGAVRIYGPKFSKEDNSRLHRVWVGDDARQLKDNWHDVRDLCMSLLHSVTGRSLYYEIRDRINQKENDDLQKRLRLSHDATEKAQESVEDVEVLQELLEETNQKYQDSLDENKRIEEAYALLKDDYKQLEWRNVQLKSQLSDKLETMASYTDSFPEFTSVKDVVEYARDNLDSLEVFGSAMESASESDFRRPDDVWAVFEKMDKCAKERVSGSLGKDISAWFREYGIDYSPHESETTKAMYSSERTFEDVFMEEHFKLGRGGDTQSHLRIHVRWQDSPGKWQVGYVGRHLPTASG